MKFLHQPIFTNDPEATILLRDKGVLTPYFVKFDIIHDSTGFPKECQILEFCITKQGLDKTRENLHYDWYIKWGGYPHFIQNESVPVSDDDREYTYLCTVENGWGDGGNCNIFVLLKDGAFGLEVEDVYMEASCH